MNIDILIDKLKQDCDGKNFESVIIIGTGEDGGLYSLKAGNVGSKKVLWYVCLLRQMWCKDD